MILYQRRYDDVICLFSGLIVEEYSHQCELLCCVNFYVLWTFYY